MIVKEHHAGHLSLIITQEILAIFICISLGK